MQDQAQCILADYVRHRYIFIIIVRYIYNGLNIFQIKTQKNFPFRYPRQLTRFGRLLLLLPCLRLVRSSTVELLFFKDTLGDVAINRVLADIYSGDAANSKP